MTSNLKNRSIGLHQITAMEAQPVELIEIAKAAGYQEVCLFTHIPNINSTEVDGEKPLFPVVTQQNKREVIAALQDTGIRVANVEFFSVFEGVDIESFREGMALGQELGARCAVTHVLDAEDSRAIDSLVKLADLAEEYSLQVGLEFMGVSPPCNSIQRALQFARAVNRPHFGIAVDMLHMMRTGSTLDQLKAVPADLIQYAQVCDGATAEVSDDYMDEALNGRLMPGMGCFPIAEILNALPETVALDVEVPNTQRQEEGVSAFTFSKQCLESTRNLLG